MTLKQSLVFLITWQINKRNLGMWKKKIKLKPDKLRHNDLKTRPSVFDHSLQFLPDTSLEKRECESFNSTDGELNSATFPSFMTSTRSLSMMVSRRCAIVSTVLSLNSSRIVSWIKASVFISTLAVASSIQSI